MSLRARTLSHRPYNFTVPARRSFSFPSGHSTAAWVLVGAFLFFALPFALEQARDRNDRANAQDAGADARRTDTGKGGASEGPLAEVSRSFGALQDAVAARVVAVSEGLTEQRLLVLWASLAGLTMVGRILSDSHWTTDTLAGAAFGSSLVMLLRKADFAVASVVSLFRRK